MCVWCAPGVCCFFFNDTATTEIYTLSLHDALPILIGAFLLVFIDVLKELPLTLILKPYKLNTLAVKAYEYASDERIAEASVPALMIVAVGLVPILILNKLFKS